MRRTLAALVLAATAALTITATATPASAVCGGGEPGDACYCPSNKLIPIDC
jgi:hypothetical protein